MQQSTINISTEDYTNLVSVTEKNNFSFNCFKRDNPNHWHIYTIKIFTKGFSYCYMIISNTVERCIISKYFDLLKISLSKSSIKNKNKKGSHPLEYSITLTKFLDNTFMPYRSKYFGNITKNKPSIFP